MLKSQKLLKYKDALKPYIALHIIQKNNIDLSFV